MEKSLADELYSEILEPKLETGQTSVPDTKPSPLLDGEDEQWCEDGSSWNGSNREFDQSSDLDREWQRRKDRFHTIGYRDGLVAGKEASAQEGFNVGFKESVVVGFNLGLVRGVTSALDCLPGELKAKIIKSQETQNKFHNLFQSVRNISTTDALKVFHDDLNKKRVKQGDNSLPQEEQSSNESVLDSCYAELKSLITDSPAIKVQLEINQ